MKFIRVIYILLFVLFVEKVVIAAQGSHYQNIVTNGFVRGLMDLTVNPFVYSLIAVAFAVYLFVQRNRANSTSMKKSYEAYLTYTLTTLVVYFLIPPTVHLLQSWMK